MKKMKNFPSTNLMWVKFLTLSIPEEGCTVTRADAIFMAAKMTEAPVDVLLIAIVKLNSSKRAMTQTEIEMHISREIS